MRSAHLKLGRVPAFRRYPRDFAFYVAFPKSSIRPLGLPIYVVGAGRLRSFAAHAKPQSVSGLKLVRCPRSLSILVAAYVDHSHSPVLAPATLAALPSTRAIETHSRPALPRLYPRSFTFYVAFPNAPFPYSRRVLCR